MPRAPPQNAEPLFRGASPPGRRSDPVASLGGLEAARSPAFVDRGDLGGSDRAPRTGPVRIHETHRSYTMPSCRISPIGPASSMSSTFSHSVVVHTPDVVGERMAGPGIRAFHLAGELAR